MPFSILNMISVGVIVVFVLGALLVWGVWRDIWTTPKQRKRPQSNDDDSGVWGSDDRNDGSGGYD